MTVIIVDTQFKALKDRNAVGVVFNVVSRGEHVSKVERFHEVIKERCRYYYTILPFKNLLRMIAVHLIKMVIFCINTFAWLKGASQILLLLSIAEGMVLDFNSHFRIIFGEFVQTCEGSANTMKKRMIDAITLGPNGNLQGGKRCYSLENQNSSTRLEECRSM